MSWRSGRRPAVAASFLLVSLVLAACGGGTTEEVTVVPLPSTTSPVSTERAATPPGAGTGTAVAAATSAPTSDDDAVVDLPSVTVHVDPAAKDLPATAAIIDVLADMLDVYRLQSPAVVILFASTDESLQWTIDTTRQLDCLHSEDPERFREIGGWADTCGLVMRVDSGSLACPPDRSPCWNVLSVAAHEFYHVIAARRLAPCTCEPLQYGNKIANWYNEGLADYTAYVTTWGAGGNTLKRAIEENSSGSRQPQVSVDLMELDRLWAESFDEPWFALLYQRSFMAVAHLVERFGEDAVLETFFDNVIRADNFVDGFEQTFGVSVAEYSLQFDQWLTTL